MNFKPKILLTLGDPNGIGPEIILKIFQRTKDLSHYNLKVIGSKKVLDHYSSLLKLKKIDAENIIELPAYKNFKVRTGKADANAGRLSGDAIRLGGELCMKKDFDAIVTLPISKESLNAGGYKFAGHTELLTSLTHSTSTVMIMYSQKIIISPVTIHIALKEVSTVLTKSLLKNKLVSLSNILRKDFKVKLPKIAVLSLNPHCSDNNLIGDEEKKIINPVIKELKKKGIKVEGPFSSDAFFGNEHYANYTATAAMYHDQGLIPFKMISPKAGVNFTGGLNIIRTSPVHGTGFDISGVGIANTESTSAAINLACKLVKIKQQ